MMGHVYDEPESPNEGACLRHDESESLNGGRMFKIYDDRNRQMRARV